ncbi:putative (S)-N-methylcoclaurine 3'-hydroxylase isozyme 2-like [Capsicum annuum]|nr:putative (S)-N-methylcoclaurine 3'-hydroxylase isozyme 2-like [Capsicum annuum]
MSEMIDFLGSRKWKTVKISEILFSTVLNTWGNIFFSKDLCDLDYERQTSGIKHVIREILEVGAMPNISDFYPVFDALDIPGLRKKIDDLIAAGTDGITSTIEWAMAELLRNKKVMHKLQAELRSNIGANDTITESNINKLPYLAACVKETLRMHPPGPFLIPHRALEC